VANSIPTIDERLEELRRQFESGDREALLEAIGIVLNAGPVAPSWVATGFNAAYVVGYQGANAKTLDEAFDIQRPEGWRQATARRRALRGVIWQRVERMRNEPSLVGHGAKRPRTAIDEKLFASVADELNRDFPDLALSGATVRETYYPIVNAVNLRARITDVLTETPQLSDEAIAKKLTAQSRRGRTRNVATPVDPQLVRTVREELVRIGALPQGSRGRP